MLADVARRPRSQIAARDANQANRSASLRWPKRPRKIKNLVFLRATEWVTRCGRYRVVRFADGTGRYHAGIRGEVAGRWAWLRLSSKPIAHRKLKHAQRACQKHARQRGQGPEARG